MRFPTPHDGFDAIRDADPADEEARDDLFARLVEQFDAADLLDAARGRLSDLGGSDAEAVLRIIEAHGGPDDFQALADALFHQPDLPAERAWEALAVLDFVGALEDHPGLAEAWDELNETIDEDDALARLLDDLEDGDDGPCLALQGFHAVEPEVRVQIIESLADVPGGPGLIEFLRLLCFAVEEKTRDAAIRTLEARPIDDPGVRDAWTSIAERHEDPRVVRLARRRLGETGLATRSTTLASRSDPRLIQAAVTGVDVEGRGAIVFLATDASSSAWTGAAFLCDLTLGVRDVVGHAGRDENSARALFDEFADPVATGGVEGDPALAVGLLASVLAVTGVNTPPALRFWIERAVGPALRAQPLDRLDLFGAWNPAEVPHQETAARSKEVLDACPRWVDRSELTLEIAREVALRSTGDPPHPKRDAGAYRYLFEHRLADRLELYRRMLYWQAALWRSSGREDLGRSAHALAWQLADPQHAVPSHPFLVELTTRSLAEAMR